MKKLSLIFLLAVAACQLSMAQKPWDNGRLKVSDNQRYLQFENGKPFFWLGETGWLLPERLDRAEAQYYLQKCRAAGYNMVQVQVMDGVPAYNIYGQPSLVDGWNFEKINQKGVYGYWDHMDYIISLAEQNGIYVGMVAIWGGLVKDGLIDVTVMHGFSFIESPLIGARLFFRKLDKDRHVSIYRGNHVVIERKTDDILHIDGDPIMMPARLEIENVYKGIHILVPPSIPNDV
jgi:hypothetical protein